jgi:crossover junction endodeoxyribonuclease RuvC
VAPPTAFRSGTAADGHGIRLAPRLEAAARARAGFVLGIDPGTRVIGFGALRLEARGPRLVGAGVIRTSARSGAAVRLGELAAGIERVLLELRPEIVVVERAFAARNVASALRIGEGRGVVLAAAARAGARVVEMPPAAAKKALVGNGQAHKTQVAAMVARLLGLACAPEPLDATDALALALAHHLRDRSPVSPV